MGVCQFYRFGKFVSYGGAGIPPKPVIGRGASRFSSRLFKIRIVIINKKHNWNGYLLSEYEGADKYVQGYEVGQTLCRHHILMKNILGV